jgi:hypothetical protein
MGFVCDLRSPVWPCRFEKLNPNPSLFPLLPSVQILFFFLLSK